MSKPRTMPAIKHPNVIQANALENAMAASHEAALADQRVKDYATAAASYAKANPLKAMGIKTDYEVAQDRFARIEDTLGQIINELAAIRAAL